MMSPVSMLHIPFRYNLRSLRVRWVTTSLTIGGITLVVATFVALMALASGLSHALSDGADPCNAVLLYKGGMSEAMSRVTVEQYQIVRFLPQVGRGPRDEPLASLESLVQINLERKSGGEAMVILRGMRPIGFEVHRVGSVTEGRRFRPLSGECIVGRGIAERHVGMHVGGTIRIGRRDFTIVGLMEASGGPMESEIWADMDDVVSAAHRDWFNSVAVRLKEPSMFPAFAAAVKADPRADLAVKSELKYYEDQAEGAEGFRIIGLLVAFFMAIGASLAEMNTMYSAIGSRTREIGTLRALGFPRRAVLASFLAEAVLLALPGGVMGCLAGASIDGFTMNVMSMATVSEVTFRFQVTPGIVGLAFVMSIVLGLAGGMMPALQAARLPVLDALRKV